VMSLEQWFSKWGSGQAAGLVPSGRVICVDGGAGSVLHIAGVGGRGLENQTPPPLNQFNVQ